MAAQPSGRLPSVGDRIDRYEVVFPIASGGMASVFAVRLRAAGGVRKLLALKVLKPELAEDAYFVDLFMDECRIASRIVHPNVVQLFDVVMHEGLPCMVMEFLRGKSLSRVLRRVAREQLSWNDDHALQVLSQAARGLDAAHRLTDGSGKPLDLVHRDISPENIHVGYDGVVKIVDFGIASTRARLTQTRAGEFKGKIAYAAPERIAMPDTVDSKADVWSLGVVAWRLLARRGLFEAEGEAALLWKVMHDDIPDISTVRSDLDADLSAAVMAALIREPAGSRPTAGEFGDTLAKYSSTGEDGLAEFMSEAFAADIDEQAERFRAAEEAHSLIVDTEPAPAPAQRRWRAAAAVALATGLAGGGIALATREPQEPAPPSAPTEPTKKDVSEPPPAEVSSPTKTPALVPASPPPAEPTPKPRTRAKKRKKRPQKRPTPAPKKKDVFGNPYGSGGK